MNRGGGTPIVANGGSRIRREAIRQIRAQVYAEYESQLADASFLKRLSIKYRRWQRAQVEIEKLPYESGDARLY